METKQDLCTVDLGCGAPLVRREESRNDWLYIRPLDGLNICAQCYSDCECLTDRVVDQRSLGLLNRVRHVLPEILIQIEKNRLLIWAIQYPLPYAVLPCSPRRLVASLLPMLPRHTLLQNNTLAIQVPTPMLSVLIRLTFPSC